MANLHCKLFVCLPFFIFLLASVGCRKYLDTKPNQKLSVPSSLQDAQALLDNYTLNNTNQPSMANIAGNDYYISDTYYNSLSAASRNIYVWSKDALMENEWSTMYTIILRANVAKETAEQVGLTASNASDWNRVMGTAYFLRAYIHFQLAEFYAGQYVVATAKSKMGIPLRLTSDVNAITTRATLDDSWQQIVSDFKTAAGLLPVTNNPVSRPNKPAAYGALARTYLIMGDYSNALAAADSALKWKDTIVDYNKLNAAATYPFSQFNNVDELFHSLTAGTGILAITNAKVDSNLYAAYDNNDLRKTILFKSNGNGTYAFRGNYEGTASSFSNGAYFNGIATDELLLIKAECNARLGNKDLAMASLNSLLVKRWKAGAFVSFTAADAATALKLVLSERRKEMIFRGLRWFDLRRLNLDATTAETVYRSVAGQLYTLPSGDTRYTFTVPAQVIALTGIPQNVR